MLDCKGRNVSAQQARRWSTACVGADADGRILLVHARAPFSTHDLIDVLLPIGIPAEIDADHGTIELPSRRARAFSSTS